MAKPYKYMYLWKRSKRTCELKHVPYISVKKNLILTLLDKAERNIPLYDSYFDVKISKIQINKITLYIGLFL